MSQLTGSPIIILREGTEQTRGRQAQKNNINAARAVAEIVQSTLGPRGLDKLLVDNLGDVIISNDGATILEEIDIQSPAAKMLVQVAKTQDQETGDGTTSSVIIAGELLKEADDLLEKKIHVSSLIQGYKLASKEAIRILDTLGVTVDIKDKEVLKNIAMTSLNSKAVSGHREHLANLAVDAVLTVLDNGKADLNNITITQKQGKMVTDSKIIKGVILDKEVVHSSMPKSISEAKIALLDIPMEVKKTEFDAKLRITDASQLTAFLDEEESILRDMADLVESSGANVVFCQKGIDDMAQHFLAKKGILAVRRVKKSDMEKLAHATGAHIVTNLNTLTSSDIGKAGQVFEEKIGDDKTVTITECPSPKSVSIILHGANKYTTDEAERALTDALSVVRNTVEDGIMVSGAGSTEIELAKQMREYAQTISGREQYAIEAFAKALEAIPKTLAQNAGLEQIDILTQLRKKHEEGNIHDGINVLTNKIENAIDAGILEPIRVKRQAILSATEAAELILRVDDVLQGLSKGGSDSGMGGMPPGMGGMPPGMGGMPPGMM